jgi:spore coat-associated protein N
MKIKNKLFMSMLLGLIGLILVTGGVSAYFTNVVSTTNSIKTGALELGVNKDTIFQIENIVPGETQVTEFELTNDGSVDMQDVILHTSYETTDHGEPNHGEDLADYIMVDLLVNENGEDVRVFEKTLAELENESETIATDFLVDDPVKEYTIEFTFIDNGEDQSHLQGDELEVHWEFETTQKSK